jgi:putative ABC transport system ATP-binding protein
MHCLAGLDTTDRGTVHIGDTAVTGLGDKSLPSFKNINNDT